MTISRSFLYMGFLCLAACGGGGGGGDGDNNNNNNNNNGTTDTVAPTLELLFPPPNQTFLATSDVILRGTASDNNGAVGIMINGVLKASNILSDWLVSMSLNLDLNTLFIGAVDGALNSSGAAVSSLIYDGPSLRSPSSVMFDSANNRLLVLDSSTNEVVALGTYNHRSNVRGRNGGFSISTLSAFIPGFDAFYFVEDMELRLMDLATGDEQLISTLDSNEVGDGPILGNVWGIAYYAAGDAVYLLGQDPTAAPGQDHVVIDINTTNGDRQVITSFTAGSGTPFTDVNAITWDSDANRLLAVAGSGRVFAINVSTGVRTLITDVGVSGSGPEFSEANTSTLVYWPLPRGTVLFVAETDEISNANYGLFSVDVDDFEIGVRRIIGPGMGPQIPDGGALGLALNPGSRTVYAIIRDLYTVLRMDADSGDSGMMSSDIGEGPRLSAPQRGRFDTANRRLLVADKRMQALLAVNVDNGNRTVLSSATTGGGDVLAQFDTPVAVDINAAGTVAYVLDPGRGAIISVNLATGDRAILSAAVDEPVDMVYDEARGRLLVADRGLDAIAAISVVDGSIQIILDDLAASSSPFVRGPVAIEIDRAGNRAFITVDDEVSGIFRHKILRLNLADDQAEELVTLAQSEAGNLYFEDLALSPDGASLYAMNVNTKVVYRINSTTGAVGMPDPFVMHAFSEHRISALETGPMNDTVYMLDEYSGAVMLMEIRGSPLNYAGVILSQ